MHISKLLGTLYFRITFKEKPFKILNLPLVVLKNVMNQMNIRSIFKLSKTSKKMYKKLRYAKRNIYKLVIDNHFEYDVGNNFPLLYQRIIIFEKKNDFVSVYRAMCKKKSSDPSTLAKYSVHFWVEWFYKIDKFGERKLVNSVYKYRNAKKCWKLLTRFDELFSIDHVDLVIDRSKLFRFHTTLEHPLFRKCDYVEIVKSYSYLTNNDMQFVLNNFNLKNGMLVKCLFWKDFKLELLFKIPRLDIFNAQQFTLDVLIKMDCKVIKLWKHELGPHHINQFIHLWMAGAMPNLRRLRCNDFCSPWQMDEILRGVEHSKWDGERRARIFCDGIERINCGIGDDIVRNDGVLATVFYINRCVDFLVWHDNKF
ncbi:F-box domain-containing protein [Caenorhabditis elegans]|uniref:F-box domain-containing protein n=1 Tax=Caenorhabditis elegans TaxID=6239 RepID=Q9XV73_CAEEL|nr:F-box domain-containing protein [Caenorhabditis elegans]CAB04160.1 F-box domain-containing protein [Caenorhabditis elegans]|eukprot:NP_507748.1 Uncharacterized protein CELE_F21D9.1 [Caenorhabditis elegans]